MSDNSGNVEIIINATDNASRVIAAASRVFDMITGAVANVTKGYIAYGDEVQNLSNFIGINSEEASRLIQVSDDAFVSYDTLKLAAKNLSEKGFQPNIETMGKLSDQFLKLEPGLARSQWLVDNFGRSGMEMSKIMVLGSAKIAQMNSSIEAGLIIDDKKAAAILKTKQEMDAFNDSMDATKYQTAQTLLDIFNGLPAPLKSVVQIMGTVGASGLLQQFSQLSILFVEIGRAGGIGAVFTSIGAGASGAAAGLWAMLAPLILIGGAVALLVKVIADNWNLIKMFGAVIGSGLGMDVTGLAKSVNQGGDNGLLSVLPMLQSRDSGGPVQAGQSYLIGGKGRPEILTMGGSGYVTPGGGGGGLVLNFTYAPAVSLASKAEAENTITPMILSILHKRGLV